MRGMKVKGNSVVRKGFTLVELLIVMVIIGILASTLMLTMGGGRGKAEATKIVSDLRNLKAAALMYYADNDKWPGGGTDTWQWVTVSLDKYLDREYADGASVDLYVVKDGSAVFVGYGKIEDNAIKNSLKGIAKDVALYGTTDVSTPSSNDIVTPNYYDGDNYVWMLVTR
jgi:general secretion pathway protein G